MQMRKRRTIFQDMYIAQTDQTVSDYRFTCI